MGKISRKELAQCGQYLVGKGQVVKGRTVNSKHKDSKR